MVSPIDSTADSEYPNGNHRRSIRLATIVSSCVAADDDASLRGAGTDGEPNPGFATHRSKPSLVRPWHVEHAQWSVVRA
jgi:hypothetical protein